MVKVFLVSRFGNDLQISDKLFVMDAGASNSKDLKLLRSHLQELRASIISVSPNVLKLSANIRAFSIWSTKLLHGFIFPKTI